MKRLRILKSFDPWKSKICSCGDKLSFNPYTGCSYRCDYCYATYIPRFWEVREKKDLLKKLEKDLAEISDDTIISMSNSSDPYPIIEREKMITRDCLKIFKEYNAKLIVVTKSDIVLRDLDLLSEIDCVICITITGCDKLEKFAPSTENRIEVFRELRDALPSVLRFDPIVPFLNESRLEIIEMCDPEHVVTSTLKLRFDSYKRISKTLPWLAPALKKLYFDDGEKIGSYYYLKSDFRISLLKKVEKFCESLGISCGFCREGIEFKAKSCDGRHLSSSFKNVNGRYFGGCNVV
ncbi:MAG: radical SAM protein [Archaeoglobaceae archaeon]|nr:radical SAM protein [Archaeoglobaceae archaeon]MDW7989493.1 radical SAM protein [Archaeoglobaceae archaeon]